MRASRLLRLLLLLLTEAGLPVIVHRGAQGGIELGFNYRARLLGLTPDEAEALVLGHDGWRVLDARPDMNSIPLGELGETRISARRYR